LGDLVRRETDLLLRVAGMLSDEVFTVFKASRTKASSICAWHSGQDNIGAPNFRFNQGLYYKVGMLEIVAWAKAWGAFSKGP
jgi:hypothetical protein